MISVNHQFLLVLDYIGISKNKLFKFYELFKSEQNLFDCFNDAPEKFYGVLTKEEFKNLKTAILSDFHLKLIAKLAKMKISCVFIDDIEYPEHLLNIPCPPVVLYYIGDLSLLSKPCVSIIGTRTPTRYGKDVTDIFAKSLASVGIVTISGLAYGLDGIVASSTIEVGGKTVAVLGGGLDKIYPSSHVDLARKVVKSGGLLLSEYLPGVKPQKHFFIERNRVIAGLSSGLIITEAGEASGTLSTAKFAIDYGRELFVVPGNITSEKSLGSNKLIAELPDSFTISPSEVIARLGYADKISVNTSRDKEYVNLSDDEKLILSLLGDYELSFDELCDMTKFPTKSLATLLTRMEISGLIKKLPGNFYCANKNI